MRRYLLILLLSTSTNAANALDMNCLRKENGNCISLNNEIGKNIVKNIINIPKAMTQIATGAGSEIVKPTENQRAEPKSMKECTRKENGKAVIDNETIRCRYGYLTH